MIDLLLQKDSQRRLREIGQDIKEASNRNDLKDVRQLHKELKEELKTLALIERVEVA